MKRLSAGARIELYRLLAQPSSVRADAIRQLFARSDTRQLAEILIDLEADTVLRLETLRTLREYGSGT